MMKEKRNNLQKSARLLKISGILFLVSISSLFLVKPMFPAGSYLLDLLIGGPFLIIFLIAPIGLYFSIKSFRNEEGSKLARFRIFYGHAFICLLIILFIIVLIGDIRSFL